MFSNQTPNYGLPQYEQNDTLNVLSDFNGAMETIDSTMKTNGLAAASAQSKADGADTKANNNATAITDLQTAQGADRTDINTLTGSVNTINSLIGNGEPTTTDKTIIGAINELDSDNASLVNDMAALKTYKGRVAISVTGDGVKTFGQLMGELTTALQAAISALGNDELLKVELFHYLGTYTLHATDLFVYSNSDTVASMSFDGVYLDANAGFAARLDDINGSVYMRKYQFDTSTFSDIAADAVADGTNITYVCSKW